MDSSFELPDKLFFKIGEVSRILETEAHVLRYWEREFAYVRPRKSRGGQRLYRRSDVETLIHIRVLLKDEGFTIAGARRRLAAERAKRRDAAQNETGADAEEILSRLQEELALVRRDRDVLRSAKAISEARLVVVEAALRAVHREVSGLLDAVVQSLPSSTKRSSGNKRGDGP